MARMEKGPRKRTIEEIDLDLVREARDFRENGQSIPVGDAAIELVRLLRTLGAFDGKRVDLSEGLDKQELAEQAQQ